MSTEFGRIHNTMVLFEGPLTCDDIEEVLLLDDLGDRDKLPVVLVTAEQPPGLVGAVAGTQDLGLILKNIELA